MDISFRPNTRLDGEETRALDDVVALFLASPYYRPGGDVRRQLQCFVTDQEGPIKGVCDAVALVALATAVSQRTAALVRAGKENR